MGLKVDRTRIKMAFLQLAGLISFFIVMLVIGTIVYKTTGLCMFCDK